MSARSRENKLTSSKNRRNRQSAKKNKRREILEQKRKEKREQQVLKEKKRLQDQKIPSGTYFLGTRSTHKQCAPPIYCGWLLHNRKIYCTGGLRPNTICIILHYLGICNNNTRSMWGIKKSDYKQLEDSALCKGESIIKNIISSNIIISLKKFNNIRKTTDLILIKSICQSIPKE
jgi:hypothetical protein